MKLNIKLTRISRPLGTEPENSRIPFITPPDPIIPTRRDVLQGISENWKTNDDERGIIRLSSSVPIGGKEKSTT